MWPYTVFRYDRHGDKRPARIGSACSVIATSVKLHMGRQPQEDMGPEGRIPGGGLQEDSRSENSIHAAMAVAVRNSIAAVKMIAVIDCS